MEHRKLNKMEYTGKKGLATFLFSRTFMFGLMVLSQLGIFMLLAYNATISHNISYIYPHLLDHSQLLI